MNLDPSIRQPPAKPVPRRSLAIITGLAVATTVALTILTFAASYSALADWASRNEHPGWVHHVWPLFLDGFVLVGSLFVLRAALVGHRAWYPLALVVIGSLASVAFNVAHVKTTGGRVTAAVPPIAALAAFELATRELYKALQNRPNTTSEAPAAEVSERELEDFRTGADQAIRSEPGTSKTPLGPLPEPIDVLLRKPGVERDPNVVDFRKPNRSGPSGSTPRPNDAPSSQRLEADFRKLAQQIWTDAPDDPEVLAQLFVDARKEAGLPQRGAGADFARLVAELRPTALRSERQLGTYVARAYKQLA